ncbi:hypothetical protein CCHR01_17895 [Colletotrichum chrysophilum]|uniref:Uncharacterized protein n=1 Tax=Colletotrichum chrysophilum TaxID=1836956 RepID=A0AAD9A1B2_9PEZI|nr:hypothetical protein CCHR01_17895 [Colletotrichum chrysophilum]
MRQLFPGRGLQSKSGALAYQSSAIFALSWGGRDPSSSNRIAIRRITAIHVVGCHTTTHIQHTPSYTYLPIHAAAALLLGSDAFLESVMGAMPVGLEFWSRACRI